MFSNTFFYDYIMKLYDYIFFSHSQVNKIGIFGTFSLYFSLFLCFNVNKCLLKSFLLLVMYLHFSHKYSRSLFWDKYVVFVV